MAAAIIDIRWTAPRRRALKILAANATARVSNRTDERPPRIYWQIAAWMEREGIARFNAVNGVMLIALTDQGRAAVEVILS